MRTFVVSTAILASVMLHAEPASFQRGDFVRVKPGTNKSEVSTPLVLRVVAGPGDRIRVRNARLYVNNVAVTGFSRGFVSRVVDTPDRIPQVVPDGHCFVMGEQRTNQDISEYWGQHSALSLERAR